MVHLEATYLAHPGLADRPTNMLWTGWRGETQLAQVQAVSAAEYMPPDQTRAVRGT